MLLALYSPGLGVPFLLLAGRALVLRRCADVTSPAGAAQLPSPCGRDRRGWQNRPCLPGGGLAEMRAEGTCQGQGAWQLSGGGRESNPPTTQRAVHRF